MKTLITAHSGANHTAENSLEYLQHVFSSSADAAEVDVRMHAGELVLGHDAVANETNESEGTGTVTHVTLRQAFTMLKQAQGNMKMNCDLKEEGLEKPVYELALETGVVDRILYTGTVSVERMRAEGVLEKVEVYLNIEEAVPALRPMWEAAQRATRGGDTSSALRAPMEGSESEGTGTVTHYYKQACEVCVDAGIRVLNVPKEIVDETFCEILKEYGLMASVWTVDDVHEAQRLARLPQVLGITTRDVVGVSHLCNPSYSNRSCSVNI